jgi:hypothetical protein
MDRGRADGLIGELGAKLGLAGLALDEEGACSLSIDGGAAIVRISFSAESGMFDFAITLDRLQSTPAVLARALSLNFCWQANAGAIFSFDPLSRRLVLSRHQPGDGLDLEGLAAMLKRLVGHALGWTKVLGAMKEEAATAAGTTSRMPLGVRA